jgi:hypothetical protein
MCRKGVFMKKKNWLMGTAAVLAALLFAMGCPQAVEEDATPAGDGLVSSVSIAGVKINPLPAAASSIAEAAACPVVVNVERPPTEKEQPGVYYKPVQPVELRLADANATVFFEVTRPDDENPLGIELPGTPAAANAALITREIGITLPNSNNFPEGQTVWIRVVAADESKTNYYRINVVSQTHDTAINAISINGNDVLDTNQSGHIGPWILGSNWAQAAAGLVNLTAAQASGVSVAQTPRNNQFDLARPKLEYAKIPAASSAGSGEPAAWSATAPASFANHDVLAVKVTASNGTSAGYLKVTVNVGGSPFLSSLAVNNNSITLGAPSAVLGSASNIAGIAVQTPAYRVEEGQSLTATPVVWSVTPVADDPGAAVSWALVARGESPSDFTSPTSFDTSHNYLYVKVVSANSEFTMYYLVVYDERPRDTEHVRAASKSVPVYKFTIPAGRTWADMGAYPKVRMKVLQEEEQFNRADGYQRNFVFGELSKFPEWNPTTGPANFTVGVGGIGSASWAVLMPLIINKQLQAWAVGSTPAPGIWYTVEYPLTYPEGTKQPWDSNTDLNAIQGYEKDQYWPDAAKTGDVYFGIGITHDEVKEYWIKELSLVSEDGGVEIFCDLLGGGRIDSTSRNIGFVSPENQATASQLLREMVADPTLE